MENRVYNFSAGPSTLPLEVLKIAQTELVSYGTSGMSGMEMSHRSGVYQDIIDQCEALIRKILGVPENYKVLFLQGGASTQFAMELKAPRRGVAITPSAPETGLAEPPIREETTKVATAMIAAAPTIHIPLGRDGLFKTSTPLT